MFHRAQRAISHFLDGVFGLLGIAILALLASIGMGLTIARINVPKDPLWEAATSTAGLMLADVTTFGVPDPMSASQSHHRQRRGQTNGR
jgi:hypothetical protein